jgi:glycosyltransferase involved in cell wall biosynthesis
LIQYRDARDVRTWSGIPYFSKAAFARHVGTVVDLSPVPIRFLPFRAARKLIKLATGKIYSIDHEPVLARYYGWYLSRRVAAARPDVIYSPSGSSAVAYLETDVPIVYFTDGPWSVIRDYYPTYTNVLRRSDRSAEELERRALARAAVVLVSSEWARDAVIRDYGIDPEKVHDVWMGANLPDPPSREEALPRSYDGGRLRLLFVGVLWDIKGGDIAHDTLLRLLEMGYDAELTVVGCRPPEGVRHPRLRVIPFLNKQMPAQRAEFARLWREAHVFILPSRAEAAGVVFCEAAAHGIPCVATHTGGIPSIIAAGRNGYTLPPSAGGAAYARKIAAMVSDPVHYARLCKTSREEYEMRLSWDAWGSSVARILADRLPALRDRFAPSPEPAASASGG